MNILVIFLILVPLLTWTTVVNTSNVTNSNTRIVGGNTADVRNHKYLVSMTYEGAQMCGGSLVSTQHVVTASHCVEHDPNRPRKFWIRAGSSNRKTGGQTRQVKKIWMHPKYNRQTIDYDIAMMKLASPIQGKWIRPIALATRPVKAGQSVMVAGWGATNVDGTDYPNVMRQVFMNVVGRKKCNREWGGGITQRKLCFIQRDKGFCFGDSGGPLTKNGKLYGVVSYVYECGSNTVPSVTANVMNLKPFIKSKLKL